MADIRIKDLASGSGVVDDTDNVVMDSAADGTRKITIAELRNALGGLQKHYEVGPAIVVTTAEGSVALSNAADGTDLLTLLRTFAGAGKLLSGSMGASTTDDAIDLVITGSGRAIDIAMNHATPAPAIEITTASPGQVCIRLDDTFSSGGELDIGPQAIEFDRNFSIVGQTSVTPASARALTVRAGHGGAGTGVVVSVAGANLILQAGNAGADGGAGRTNGGNVVIDAGDGATDGTVVIGQTNTALVHLNAVDNTIEANGGVARLKSSQAAIDAVRIEATNAAGGVQVNIGGTETLRVESGQVLHHFGTVPAPGISFLADDDTGLRRFAADSIGVVLGGFEYWIFQGGILYGNFTTALTIAALNANTPVMLRGLTTTAAQASTTIDNSGTALSGGAAAAQKLVALVATLNQTSTAAFTALEVNITETTVGTGLQRRIDVKTGGVSQWWLDNKGRPSVKSHASFAGSEYTAETGAVRTTDGTQTTIFAKTLADNTLYWIEAKVIGRDEAGTERAFYVRRVRVHRQGGGGATLSGTIDTSFTDETAAGPDATFTVNGNDVRVSVTGIAATNISWACTVEVQGVSTNA